MPCIFVCSFLVGSVVIALLDISPRGILVYDSFGRPRICYASSLAAKYVLPFSTV